MSPSTPPHATLADWIARESVACALDDAQAFNAAVDRLIAAVGDGIELLGCGEALHGGEEMFLLRNRLFERLVAAHGYSAIALESSFLRGRVANDYVNGRGEVTLDEALEQGFSHEFGRLDANRELIEWMRRYNADPSHAVKLQFYGFDSPTEMTGTDSPRHVLRFALDYFEAVAGNSGRRDRIEALLGEDAAWENPAALMDPTQSIGRSPEAQALRIETEDFITELAMRRPELEAKSGADAYREAVYSLAVARWLLNYHAGLALASPQRLQDLLGMRDALMADNLVHILERERLRNSNDAKLAVRVFAHAHNAHLKCGQAQWQMGPQLLAWWPAGSHLHARLEGRYAVIGTGLGSSPENGIGDPEAATLEALLAVAPGQVRFIPTHKGSGLPAGEIAGLPARSGSTKNFSYFPFTPQSFTDFDWLAVLGSVRYSRGGRPLP